MENEVEVADYPDSTVPIEEYHTGKPMKHFVLFAWALVLLAVAGALSSLFGLPQTMRSSIAHGHLIDWIMGALCLLWLLIILKVPWDLYFQAHAVAFELQRARERNVPAVAGREEYIQALRRRLGLLAVGAHLLSALLVAGVAHFVHGALGYYFAVFYLVSTVFRPAVAGYVYLSRKLWAIGREARYPREDVVELGRRVKQQQEQLKELTTQLKSHGEQLQRGMTSREAEARELRQNLQAIGREFEAAISRLTDNQEVIKGIQAFVRLIAQASQSST